MTRIEPDPLLYSGLPCSFVAVNCARQMNNENPAFCVTEMPEGLRKSDGYLTLNGLNKYSRAHLNVAKRKDYRRGERPKLRDLHLDGKAVVVVYGHCIYVDGETYYSYFENEDDEVVAVWQLTERPCKD